MTDDPNSPLQKILRWISGTWFLLLSLALLIFIALYPKIPLADLIPGYIVRLRLEDVFLALVLIVFSIQLFRRKVTLKTPITFLLIAYIFVGFASMLSALFVVKTVPLEPLHIGKMVLHFLRRLEYFSLFFLFYNAISSFRHVRMVLIGLLTIMVGVSIFGFGQKYLYWPVYSTMNREFSKGMRLVLTEHARVPSTFGGHYDMSAFMMFLLTITLSLIYFSRSKKEQFILLCVYAMSFWLLILGSSRSSFLSYLLAVGMLTLLVGIYKRSFWWTISRGLLVIGMSLLVMVTLGDLSSRFSQLGIVKQINTQLSSLLKPVREKPPNTIAVDPLDKTDALPEPVTTPSSKPATPPPKQELPPDVYVEVPDKKTVLATEGGKVVSKVIEVPREFSSCTYRYGLSACIRFETLWPRAINGFIRNPLVGSGYSTLTKSVQIEFTEAESTDNDFLRTLGEVGLLGALTFYGPIALFLYRFSQSVVIKQRALASGVLFGIAAGSLGMLFNALYIDVFAASKVAFLFWAVMGLGFSVLELMSRRAVAQKSKGA